MFMQKMSRLLLMLFLLAFFATPAVAGLAKGHGPGKGSDDCVTPLTTECDPDFDDEVSLLPHNYDFDGVPVGTEALPMSFAVLNTSGASVEIGTISVSGDGINTCMAIGCPVIADGEFFLLSDECSGALLPDEGSCELEVGFLPTTEGEYLTGLWVPYTPAGGESATIRGKLTGAGIIDDGSGFSLSGAINLFERPGMTRGQPTEPPSPDEKAPPNGANEGVPPKAHPWQPVAGVSVTLDNGLTTLTNEQGEYRFDGLEKGTYAVTPSADGYRFLPPVRHTRITGRDRLGIEFRARTTPVETE